MTEQALSGSYDVVKNEIVRVLLEGHEKARQAVERERLRAYWEGGEDPRGPSARGSWRVGVRHAADEPARGRSPVGPAAPL